MRCNAIQCVVPFIEDKRSTRNGGGDTHMGNTDFLYKTETMIDGAGRAIDLFGDFDTYDFSRTPEEADAKALYYDLRALREDADKAFQSLKSQYRTKTA